MAPISQLRRFEHGLEFAKLFEFDANPAVWPCLLKFFFPRVREHSNSIIVGLRYYLPY
jgi:hypothetical protein